MAVDFDSGDFIQLSTDEKRNIVVREFNACRQDFEYYLDNYAYIRHPNVGVIQMSAFDFQKDVALPIAQTLRHKRSVDSVQQLKHYQNKFDYEQWWKQIAEENIELSKVIPPEMHNFHRVTAKHEDFNQRVDTILLKSRQTGLSTIFQQLCVWHINFNRNIYDLVLSQTDREAIKFLNDLTAAYEEMPAALRARKLNANEHELWCSITGGKGKRSGVQALPPTTKAGRSYSPNLVILDEFAEYAHAEQVWTAISMSVSAGGIIVIIATPKGVGNLYHKIWEMTNKSLTVNISNNPLADGAVDKENAALSVFRPMTVHWSQLPHEEFARRGFASSLSWYKHMCAKISMDRGEQAIAQELDLDFMASGNTVAPNVLKSLRKNSIEGTENNITVLDEAIPGLVVYEPPKAGKEYLMGVDTGEGVRADYSVLTVFEVPTDSLTQGVLPKVVSKFSSNVMSVRRYTDVVQNVGLFYNTAWMNVERNNHGHVLLAYFVEDGMYPEERVLNRYDAIKATFAKDVKGWATQVASRTLLITTFLDFLSTYKDELRIPLDLSDELKTFVQKSNGKWEAQETYNDDHILSYSLALIGWKLLPRYKEYLMSLGKGGELLLADDDILIGGSSLLPTEQDAVTEFLKKQSVLPKKQQALKTKKEVDIEELRGKFDVDKIKELRSKTLQHIPQNNQLYLSTVIDDFEDGDIGVF